MVPLLLAVGGRHGGERTSAACAGDAAASDRAASVTEYGRLRADDAEWLGRDRRPIERGAGRQACEVQWRAVPAVGRRSPDAGAYAGQFGQDAGDSAARQPRRRSEPAPEIAGIRKRPYLQRLGFALRFGLGSRFA